MVKTKRDAFGHGPRKKIANKMYRRFLQTNSRYGAQQAAKGLRKEGFMARASRQQKNKEYPWAVYYRTKTDYRKEDYGYSRRRKK